MTSTTSTNEVFKQDRRGRVRVPRERREALLDEFERSGLSGARFAGLVGIKYATFANWRQQRRKQRTAASQSAPGDVAMRASAPVAGLGGAQRLRLVEAVVEDGGQRPPPVSGGGLMIDLPGGGRLSLHSPAQLAMAAELLALIAQSARARC